MFRCFLIAGLVVLTFTLVAKADVHRNEEHQFEADFPTKALPYTQKVEDGTKVVMALSKDSAYLFALGVSVNTDQELLPEHIGALAQGFAESFMGTRKNATISKEETDIKLSDTAPKGQSFMVKHDTGWMYGWVTIENGKGYFVMIEAKSEESLKSEVVKKFLKSVKITGVK